MCLNETNFYFYPHGKSLQWTYLLLEGFKVWNMNAKKNVTFCSADQTFSRVWQKPCFCGKAQVVQVWVFPEQDHGFALADTYTFLHCVSNMSPLSLSVSGMDLNQTVQSACSCLSGEIPGIQTSSMTGIFV